MSELGWASEHQPPLVKGQSFWHIPVSVGTVVFLISSVLISNDSCRRHGLMPEKDEWLQARVMEWLRNELL